MAIVNDPNRIDLSECLAAWLAKKSGLPIKVDFLAPDNHIGLVPNPGSHEVSKDMSGLSEWQYNYAIALSTKDAKEAEYKLAHIQNCLLDLQDAKDLKSNNGSWSFDRIEVNSAPAMTLKDVKGTVVYELDMAVFIYVQK